MSEFHGSSDDMEVTPFHRYKHLEDIDCTIDDILESAQRYKENEYRRDELIKIINYATKLLGN